MRACTGCGQPYICKQYGCAAKHQQNYERDLANAPEALAQRYRAALEEIATGHIAGERGNHRDTVAVLRRIALQALVDAP